MRKDAGVDGDAQRIAQLAWLLFLKVIDDRDAVPEALRWRTWARDRARTGAALLDFVDHRLFAELETLRAGELSSVIRSVFADARNCMTSGALLRRVIDTLDDLDLGAPDRHAVGEVYETMLADLQSAGDAGEFYTPRAVTRFVVAQIAPRLGETVLDPACGTGGFLASAIEHIRARWVRCAADEATLQTSILGIEKKPLPHVLCVTNMLLHGIAVPSLIRRGNALVPPRDAPWDQVDVVISNPPFGGMEEDEIAISVPPRFRTRDTTALFLADIVSRLRPGGRAAVVIPDGELLFQTAGVHARIKQALLDECAVHTIVRLPRGAFQPYTEARTNLVFFTKGEPTGTIWFYEHPAPPGARGYSRTRPIRSDEFAAAQRWWHAREPDAHAWPVDIAEIRARGYNLDLRRPAATGASGCGPPGLATGYRSAAAAVDRAREVLLDHLQAGLRAGANGDRSATEGKLRQLADSFEVVAATASGIRRLREAIFECAVTGRLVEQRADDEPAAALLARIAAQPGGAPRGRGRARDARDAAPPHRLPAGWSWARFDRVATIDSQPVLPAKFPDLPHVAPDNIEKATGRLLAYRSVRDDGVTSSKHRFFAGQILYAKIRPNLSKAVRIDFDGLCSADMYPLTARIDARYFHIYLLSRTFRDQVAQRDNRLAMPKVNQAQLLATVVAVPPLAEQRRIADQVEQLMQLCDALERELQGKEQHAAALVDAAIANLVGESE